MTAPKRARDLRVGDILPDDGSVVRHIGPGSRGLSIRARRPDGTLRRMAYAPDTIMPTTPEEHPSRFESGHPWDRKRTIYQDKRTF